MKQTKIFEATKIDKLEAMINKYIAEELESKASVIDIKMSTWACQNSYQEACYYYQAMIIYEKER